MIYVDVDVKREGEIKDVGDKMFKRFKQMVLSLERNIKIEAPVKTSLLRSSIHHEINEPTSADDTYSAVVGTNVNYAPYVNFGAASHIIVPLDKKALKFNMGGQTVFAKKVFHPGTQPNPFFERGIEITKKEFGLI